MDLTRRTLCLLFIGVGCIHAPRVAMSQEAPDVVWTRLMATTSDEFALSIDLDPDGNIFVAGNTEGDLCGASNSGWGDAFLTKHDPNGNRLWTRVVGTSDWEEAYAVAVDGGGNAYISGITGGNLDGNSDAGTLGSFLIKYDPNGMELWRRQFAATSTMCLVLDARENSYLAGFTRDDIDGNTNAGEGDAFLTKVDRDGHVLWTRLLGTEGEDCALSVAADVNGHIYIGGYTQGNLDGNVNAGLAGNYHARFDAFLTKYDQDGNKLWTRQFGTREEEFAPSVSVDGNGGVYICGYTRGRLGAATAGEADAFVAKYDVDGHRVWTRQFGTRDHDTVSSVAIDGNGSVYLTGYTSGDFDGNVNAGKSDLVVIMYNAEGERIWTQQIGTDAHDSGTSVAIDTNGSIYIGGGTTGDLHGNTNRGASDVFLMKLELPVP